MITKNLLATIKRSLLNSASPIKMVDGSLQDNVVFFGSFGISAKNVNDAVDYTNTDAGLHFLFGSGDTPVTIDDYKLGELVTTYQGMAMNHTTFNDYSENVFHVTRTIKNTSESSITIKEMGVFGVYSGKLFMLARTVLPTPVTIEPNEMHDFAMLISLE